MKARNNENEMYSVAEVSEDQVREESEIEGGAEATINLDPTLSIQNVVTLHEKLKNSYAAHDSLVIDASQVSSIDTATLQLLVALKKEASKQQKNVDITSPTRRFIESAELLGVLEILEIDAMD